MVEARFVVADLIDAGAARLQGAGIAEPRRESLRIWADLERVSVADVVLRCDTPAEPAVADRFDGAIGRRAAGEPLAYVTGWAGFRRLTLRCDQRALIPRPETEGLVELALSRVRGGVAADIGTGTGAIALALRDEGRFDHVIGVDLSPGAVALAARNAATTGIAISLVAGDLTGPLAGQRVDLLVSNPPYLTRAEYDSADRSVRDYEPELALVAGEDGLLLTRRLLDEARRLMVPGGWIALELDCGRASDVGRMAAGLGWLDVAVLDDLYGRARYLLARQGSRS